MSLRIGFHLEGHDHLIIRALLARLLEQPESAIESDQVDLNSRGWQKIVQMMPDALRRFYYTEMRCAVVGIDNDGNHNLVKSGKGEDPSRPRHWNHSGENATCRYCWLSRIVEDTRRRFKDLPHRCSSTWPVIISVPVESIEAWMLALRALTEGRPEVYFENQLRQTLKERLYRRPAATRTDVEGVALPLIHGASREQLRRLGEVSRSFGGFAAQVDRARPLILDDLGS